MTRLMQKILSHRHKNNRLWYNAVSYIRYCTPLCIKQRNSRRLLASYARLNSDEQANVYQRVDYYNRLPHGSRLTSTDGYKIYTVGDLQLNAVFNEFRSRSPYVFDAHRYLSVYPKSFRVGFMFGDVTIVPPQPSFLKSRPINGDNINSVLLPLNRIRHFVFVNDPRRFMEKKDMLIGMAYLDQPQRKRFWEHYFDNPRCRLGNINRNYTEHPQWNVDPVSIDEHLKYRYVLCIEGNDVATCLKWVMSSNSLAVMPKPKYETWFMEGRLVGGYHYVEISDDYCDLIEKMDYYSSHPAEAQAIIDHAHEFISQFRNHKRENLIAQMTVDKYFQATGQK